MKLKNKLILIFVTIIGAYSILSLLIVKYYIMPSSVALCEFFALNDFNRCILAVEETARRIEINATDWATWDPTSDFMQGKNVNSYITMTLEPVNFREVSLDLIMYFDRDGKLYWGNILQEGRRDTFDTRTALMISDIIRGKYPFILKEDQGHVSKAGVITGLHGAFVIASCPINKTAGGGTERLGTLVMGTRLDSSLVAFLSGMVLVKFQLFPLNPETKRKYSGIIQALKSCATYFDYANSKGEVLFTYAYLKDINGQPAMLFEAGLNRHYYLDTYSTMKYFMQIMLALGLVSLFVLILILQRMVIKPVVNLTGEIIKIKNDWRSIIGITTTKNDEIGILIKHINDMQHTISEHRENLESLVEQKSLEVIQSRKETIVKLASAAEKRDIETGAHIERIGRLAEMLSAKAGLSPHNSELIGLASILHDIGKIGIPDHILKKPGRLSQDELAIIKTHSVIGMHILEGATSDLLKVAGDIAMYHHEKWNGKGYPKGISGENIPFSARVVAVVDVFDALLSERVYKTALEPEEVRKYFAMNREVEFDPNLTDILLKDFQEFLDQRNRT